MQDVEQAPNLYSLAAPIGEFVSADYCRCPVGQNSAESAFGNTAFPLPTPHSQYSMLQERKFYLFPLSNPFSSSVLRESTWKETLLDSSQEIEME